VPFVVHDLGRLARITAKLSISRLFCSVRASILAGPPGIDVPSFGLTKIVVVTFALVALGAIDGCSKGGDSDQSPIHDALDLVGRNRESITLPKTLPVRLNNTGMQKFSSLMRFPPNAINLGTKLRELPVGDSRSRYLFRVLATMDVVSSDWRSAPSPDIAADSVWAALTAGAPGQAVSAEMPDTLKTTSAFNDEILRVLAAIAIAGQDWKRHGGQPTADELSRIDAHLRGAITHNGGDNEPFKLNGNAYHQIGARAQVDELAVSLLHLFSVLEDVVPRLMLVPGTDDLIEWETPLGIVRIAGMNNHEHRGDFLLLIDMGGDDTYTDVGTTISPGNVSVVIDLAGNDSVFWRETFGPASGIFGTGIWWDLAGNDSYSGGNWGLGAALVGGAVFWDDAGDDVYRGGGLTQGAGHHGVAFFVDADGDDRYVADIASQGYGGPGGLGVIADLAGNDNYTCGGRYPDNAPSRVKRHIYRHYFSMCQGFAFGLRPSVSGGIGLSLDRAGDDTYRADIFAQGAGYFFGLGLLVDGDGDDSYEAFEHAQGEGLHRGAGFLGDWSGNDAYRGFEHVQGVGKDESFGVLYDERGNDIYEADNESQGAGLMMAGFGVLLDKAGDDRYEATRDSQGLSKAGMAAPADVVPADVAPADVAPVGILMDLGGQDVISQADERITEVTERVRDDFGVLIKR
jgi:hypothetical protein